MFKLFYIIVFINLIKFTIQSDHRDEEFLLVANQTTIFKFNESNFKSSRIIKLPNDHNVQNFDYSFKERLVFWLSYLDKSIYVQNIDTGEIINLLFKNQKGSIEHLAVDWLTKKIYYIRKEPFRIEVCDYNGKNNSLILILNDEIPRSIAVAPLSGLLFWNDNLMRTISRISMNGDETTRKIIAYNTTAYAMSVDHNLKKVYWSDLIDGKVKSCDFNGQYQRVIVSAYTQTVAFFNGYVYYSDDLQRSVYSIDVVERSKKRELIKYENSTLSHLSYFSYQNQPHKLSPCLTNNGGCSNLCLLSSEVPYYSCSCPTGIQLFSSDNKTCKKFPDSFLLVSFSDQIKFISLDTNHCLPKSTKIKNQVKITSVDFDPFEQRIYWTSKNKVKSAFLNGTDEKLITECDLEYERLKIDIKNRNIYLVKNEITKIEQHAKEYSSNFSIEVVSLDGRFKKTLIDNLIVKPRAIAVDERNEYFYWSDWAKNKAKIERVSFDLKDRKVIISDLIWPNDILVDKELDRLYWCDARRFSIEYSDLNGLGRQILFTLKDALFLDLTLHSGYIYWLDKNKDQIGRVHKTSGKYEILSNKDQKLGNILAIKAVSTLLTNNQLNQEQQAIEKRKCSQLSLSDNLCSCSDGFQLENDNRTCSLGANSCNLNNGDCEQNCHQIIGNYRKCSCEFGYALNDDQTSCRTSSLASLPFPSCNEKANNPCSHDCVEIGEDFHCKCPEGMYLNKEGKTCLILGVDSSPIAVDPLPKKEDTLTLKIGVIVLCTILIFVISGFVVRYLLKRRKNECRKSKEKSVRRSGSGKSLSNIGLSNGFRSNRSTSVLVQRESRFPDTSESTLSRSSTKLDYTISSVNIEDQNCFNYDDTSTDITTTMYVPPPTPFTPLKQEYDEFSGLYEDSEFQISKFSSKFDNSINENDEKFKEEHYIINRNDGLKFKIEDEFNSKEFLNYHNLDLDQDYLRDPPNSRNSPTPSSSFYNQK